MSLLQLTNILFPTQMGTAQLDVAVAAVEATELGHWSGVEMSENAKQSLVWQVVAGLAGLREGGTLVLMLEDCWTRFAAGLLFVLRQCFSRLGVTKPFLSPPWCPQRFVVCQQAVPGRGPVLTYLQATLQRLYAAGEGGLTALTLVPEPTLLRDEQFLHTLAKVNTALARRERQALERLMAARKSRPPSIPDDGIGFGREALILALGNADGGGGSVAAASADNPSAGAGHGAESKKRAMGGEEDGGEGRSVRQRRERQPPPCDLYSKC